MDAEDASSTGGKENLVSRPPTLDDLVALRGRLNDLGARYMIVGGFAIILTGLARATGDLDILIHTSAENEALVFKANISTGS